LDHHGREDEQTRRHSDGYKGLYPVNEKKAEEYPAADVTDVVCDVQMAGSERVMSLLKNLQSVRKHETHQEAIKADEDHDVKEYAIESWRCAMNEDRFSHGTDENELWQGKQCHQGNEDRVSCYRGTGERLCDQATDSCQQKPGEEHEGYGDFISMELGEKFSDRDKLNSEGRYSSPYNGPNDEIAEVQQRMPLNV
jgi:hypothetical protein